MVGRGRAQSAGRVWWLGRYKEWEDRGSLEGEGRIVGRGLPDALPPWPCFASWELRSLSDSFAISRRSLPWYSTDIMGLCT